VNVNVLYAEGTLECHKVIVSALCQGMFQSELQYLEIHCALMHIHLGN
jgi:hypothetical protein